MPKKIVHLSRSDIPKIKKELKTVCGKWLQTIEYGYEYEQFEPQLDIITKIPNGLVCELHKNMVTVLENLKKKYGEFSYKVYALCKCGTQDRVFDWRDNNDPCKCIECSDKEFPPKPLKCSVCKKTFKGPNEWAVLLEARVGDYNGNNPINVDFRPRNLHTYWNFCSEECAKKKFKEGLHKFLDNPNIKKMLNEKTK